MFAFLKSAWFIQLLIITLLALFIWFFGSFIAFADYKPWQSELSRLLTILVIIVLWSLNNLRKLYNHHQTNSSSEPSTTANEPSKTNALDTSTQSITEIENLSLSQRFTEALNTLKLFTGQRSVYELPWYLLLGATNTGKTAVLLNSGLEFPLNNGLGKNLHPTEECTWWFSDDAVLLDTPGNYCSQRNEDDKTLWLNLLALLKKHRPRRLLNGVIITVSVVDLLTQDEEERKRTAFMIRSRLDELYKQSGVRIPVYLLLTKADLIAGFSDYFALLTKEERAEVWGMTFSSEDFSSERVSKEFDALLNRLNERLLKRLQDERDLQRRHLIFSFPQRVALLKTHLLNFLQEAYAANRYQKSAYLRGLYMVSSLQTGVPFDGLMEKFSTTLKLGRFTIPQTQGSKSYFIQRLLTDVIFTEALLVGFNKVIERKQSLLRLAAYSLALLLTVSMGVLWFNSYTANQQLLTQFNQQLQHYDTVSAQPLKPTDFSGILPRMNALRDLTNIYPQAPDWTIRLGLYQGEKLQPLAVGSYQQLLQKQFLPMIIARLEQRLSSPEASNPEVHYQLLKVYLMLGDPKKLEVALVRLWVAVDWSKTYSADQQTQLIEHLNALLKLPPEAQKLNQRLIAASRQVLTRIPIAQQLYMRVKSEALQSNGKDFQLSAALAPNGDKVFSTIKGTLAEQTIPYLYTYDGFYQVFLKQSKELAEQSVQQNWVLGETFSTNTPDVSTLAQAMQVYYDQDFIRYWDSLLANLKMNDISNLQQATDILAFASAADSPIRQLLVTLDKQTSLTRKPPSALDKLDKGITDKRVEKLLDTVKTEDNLPALGIQVEQHYQPLTSMLKAGVDGKIPLDQTIATLGQLYGYMIDLSNTANKGEAAKIASPANSEAVAKMQLEAARLPEPLKSMTQILTAGNLTVMLNNSKNQLNQLWQTNVLPLYDSGLAWRYPFWRTSVKEVALQDFGRFFAKNGIVDQFFSKNLQAFVDTTGKNWKLIKQDDKTVIISDAALLQFQYAEKIRQVFFAEGGNLPVVKFHLKPVSVSENVSKFWLNLEGQKIEYAKNTLKNTIALQWPGTDGSLAVSFGFETEDGKKFRHQEEGAWAWFRVLDKANMQDTGRDSYLITFTIDELQASYELTANSIDNPFALKELSSINFPLSLSP